MQHLTMTYNRLRNQDPVTDADLLSSQAESDDDNDENIKNALPMKSLLRKKRRISGNSGRENNYHHNHQNSHFGKVYSKLKNNEDNEDDEDVCSSSNDNLIQIYNRNKVTGELLHEQQQKEQQGSDVKNTSTSNCECNFNTSGGQKELNCCNKCLDCSVVKDNATITIITEGKEKSNTSKDLDGCLSDINASFMPIAPPLNESSSHHVVFIAHPNDHNWVTDVINRLQSPALGFKCWYQRKDLDNFSEKTTTNGGTIIDSTATTNFYTSSQKTNLNGDWSSFGSNGIRNPLKTVIVISKDFVNDFVVNPSTAPFSTQDLATSVNMELLLVLLDDCDIPPQLFNVVSIDARDSSWWTRIIGQLCSFDDLGSDDRRSSTYSAATSANGYLIHSIKSRCIYCGQEMIDTSDVPQEFMLNGIRISQEEYRCALQHLMKDSKFRCHVWCYSVPAAIVFFTLFLGICLTAIPLLETKYVLKGKQGNGLEFVHGGVVWLCVLTGYMLVMHISKKKMKISTYQRLRYVNTILSKHKLLAGVENLGMADCNKYYLHFFYFDLGPCLVYLQELFAAMDDPLSTAHHTGDNTELAVDIDCDRNDQADHNDLGATFTNANMQSKAEELVLQKSGEYLNHLIGKRLERPHRVRHMKNYPCMCQYVEDHAYKIAS